MLEIVVDKKTFLEPLSKIQGVVDKKNIMSIINNCYLYTTEDRLYIEATDLEISYRCNIPCQIINQGALLINADKLFNLIKEFPSEEIHIVEDENHWIQLSLGQKLLFKIAGLPPDEFPVFRQVSQHNSILVPGDMLPSMVEKVIFSTASEDQQFHLSGIYVEKIKKDDDQMYLRMVTSDGHRLTVIDAKLDGQDLELNKGVIIPRKGAQEIRKILPSDEKVRFGFDENFCFLNSSHEELVIRLVDGRFPQYQAIIPEERTRSIQFSKQDIYESLKRISLLYTDVIYKGVKARVQDDTIELESLSKEAGEGREVIPITYDGQPFEFAFNAKYFMDALNVMDSQVVNLTVNNLSSPCVIEGKDDPGYMALIMPMTLMDEED